MLYYVNYDRMEASTEAVPDTSKAVAPFISAEVAATVSLRVTQWPESDFSLTIPEVCKKRISYNHMAQCPDSKSSCKTQILGHHEKNYITLYHSYSENWEVWTASALSKTKGNSKLRKWFRMNNGLPTTNWTQEILHVEGRRRNPKVNHKQHLKSFVQPKLAALWSQSELIIFHYPFSSI